MLLDPATDGRDAGFTAPPTSASTVAATTSTLGLAGGAWLLTVRQMSGMDMGVATRLGSFGSFLALWLSMMAAMMLPGAVPAVFRRAHARSRVRAAPSFVGSYLAIWTIVGVGVYAVYSPHGTLSAGVIVIAAGVYELTWKPPYLSLRVRGVSNATLQIYPGGFAVRSRFGERRGGWCEVEYRWPAVVIQTLRPLGRPSLLFEMNGELASCTVTYDRGRLRSALEHAGLTMIEVRRWGWERPHRVARDALGEHAEEVPGAVVAR